MLFERITEKLSDILESCKTAPTNTFDIQPTYNLLLQNKLDNEGINVAEALKRAVASMDISKYSNYLLYINCGSFFHNYVKKSFVKFFF
jgi:hypothetical protein